MEVQVNLHWFKDKNLNFLTAHTMKIFWQNPPKKDRKKKENKKKKKENRKTFKTYAKKKVPLKNSQR